MHKGEPQKMKSVGHMGRGVYPFSKDQVPGSDVKQGKAHHDEPHHGTAAEGNLQPLVEGFGGPMSSACRSMGGGLHPQETA